MPTALPTTKLPNNHQRIGGLGLGGIDMFVMSVCRALSVGVFVCIIFFFFMFLLYYPACQSDRIFSPIQHLWIAPLPPPPILSPSDSHLSSSSSASTTENESPTDLSHIVFGIIGSTNAWRRNRRHYIESWWKPNITRGYLYLDTPPTEDLLPWPATSPPYRISADNSQLLAITHQNDTMVRIARGLLETFGEEEWEKKGVRWIVMGDDDSIFFLDNIIRVLRKYDHNKYWYIGGHSESALPNLIHSYDMGFGGAGVFFSYPLAAALVPRLDDCLKRYPMLYAADQMWQSCLADMGVYLTHEKGIHQIDLRGDLSGLLSAHPQAPLISLHHPDTVEPYFPRMNRHQSVSHLMKAAKVDQSRLLQQAICYDREKHWSFSVSWGYSIHVYENIYSRSILQKPLETFKPWVTRNVHPPLFIFNTRVPKMDPCETPHIFYFESVKRVGEDQVLTTYARAAKRMLPTCSFSANHSAETVFKVQVLSPAKQLTEDIGRDCCEVTNAGKEKIAKIRYRTCLKDEVVG